MPSARITALAESTLLDALDTQSAATLSAAALHTLEPGTPREPPAGGDALAAYVLGSSQAGDRALAAIAVVITDGTPPGSAPLDRPSAPEASAQPTTALLELLGSTLLDQDDVDPVTRVA